MDCSVCKSVSRRQQAAHVWHLNLSLSTPFYLDWHLFCLKLLPSALSTLLFSKKKKKEKKPISVAFYSPIPPFEWFPVVSCVSFYLWAISTFSLQLNRLLYQYVNCLWYDWLTCVLVFIRADQNAEYVLICKCGHTVNVLVVVSILPIFAVKLS